MKNNSEVKKAGVLALKDYGQQGMKTDHGERKLLRFDQVHYIITCETKNKLIVGTGEKGKEYYLHGALSTVEEELPNNFLQISQSFIINVDKIEGRKNHKIICMKFREFIVGTTFQKSVNDFFNRGYLK